LAQVLFFGMFQVGFVGFQIGFIFSAKVLANKGFWVFSVFGKSFFLVLAKE
jgi:hypothetical protein